jgi:hypothetical protein
MRHWCPAGGRDAVLDRRGCGCVDYGLATVALKALSVVRNAWAGSRNARRSAMVASMRCGPLNHSKRIDQPYRNILVLTDNNGMRRTLSISWRGLG